MALAKQYRLKGKKEFERVKKEGRLINGLLFSLLILKSQQTDGPKFGFVVSKKIDKRAVVRNRIRRLISEAVRQVLPDIRQDLKVVFLAKLSLKKASSEEVFSSVRRFLGKYAEKNPKCGTHCFINH